MSRVAIVAAMPGELGPLVRGWRRRRRSGVDLWTRRPGEGDWAAACAGAGAAAAARALEEIERDGAADCVVSVGWAGALRWEFVPGRSYRISGVTDARTGERFPCAWSGECWVVTSPRVAGAAD
jgi:adenosylhomocysteine nucleosidase